MNPRVAPQRAQYIMLNFIERQSDTVDRHDFHLPGAGGKESGFDFLDGFYRIFVKNDIEGFGIVKIDPECILLILFNGSTFGIIEVPIIDILVDFTHFGEFFRQLWGGIFADMVEYVFGRCAKVLSVPAEQF